MKSWNVFSVFSFACFTSFLFSSCGGNINYGVVNEDPFDTSRLVKIHLAGNFDEPMEIAITEQGKVIIVERKGAVKLYDPSSKIVKQVYNVPVYSGQEDGLLGVTLDPAFKDNNFIYFFYSPAGSNAIQRVSRFTMSGDSVVAGSEKILIEIPTQRTECCHSAGSLAFGPDGNLFIAVGDNTNPHNPGYYNSIDERKGREYWDAQRTAGNANDLRGKILRIHPEPDGTYTIPKGNLFPEGTPGTKPEIYVMGSRNPYRIAVDPKKGWLYWGDVGQNTIDDPKRGPISYDEWNLATAPGFFGWPYFAGPNSAYADFDFATEKIGPFFDSTKPVNTSVNNTGIQQLPPAKRALIWYSYDQSKLFPHLGTGGKSPIAGPVFYTDNYNSRINDTTRHLHTHFNNKVFIAEWMRDWINVLTLDDQGNLDTIEPFMRGTKFSHPIDLEISPDGVLYVLEYGTNWFSKNSDAGLYRIEYQRGPLEEIAKSRPVNAEPEIIFDVVNGSNSFYWSDQPMEYTIEVRDKEDGSLQQGTIDAKQVKASLSYSTMGTDLTMVAQAHERVTATEPDFDLIKGSDCKSCHAMNDKSVGPSYMAIAERYGGDTATIGRLAAKIIKGGAGVWGEHAMSAHPQISNEDAREIVKYILSLKDNTTEAKVIPVKGKLNTERRKERGDYIVSVSYRDREQQGAAFHDVKKHFHLRYPQVQATAFNESSGVEKVGRSLAKFQQQGSWIMFRNIDLEGIRSLEVEASATGGEGVLSVHAGSRDGAELGRVSLQPGAAGTLRKTSFVLQPSAEQQDLYFVYSSPAQGEPSLTLRSITFSKKSR